MDTGYVGVVGDRWVERGRWLAGATDGSGAGILPAPGFGVTIGEGEIPRAVMSLGGKVDEFVSIGLARVESIHVDEERRVIDAVFALVEKDEQSGWRRIGDVIYVPELAVAGGVRRGSVAEVGVHGVTANPGLAQASRRHRAIAQIGGAFEDHVRVDVRPEQRFHEFDPVGVVCARLIQRKPTSRPGEVRPGVRAHAVEVADEFAGVVLRIEDPGATQLAEVVQAGSSLAGDPEVGMRWEIKDGQDRKCGQEDDEFPQGERGG